MDGLARRRAAADGTFVTWRRTDRPTTVPTARRDRPGRRSTFPRSPWQPDGAGSTAPPTDGLGVVGGPAGPPALGDVIDLAPPDDGGFIDLGDPDRSSAVEVVPDDGVRPQAPRVSGRLDAFVATLFGAVHAGRDPSRRPRTRPATDRTRTAIIDLGERHGDVPTDGARPGPSPWRSLEWRAHMRPFALVIVVVAALLVGGSVAPPPSRLARLANITVPLGASLADEGARAVVLGSRDGVGESIAAYNVAGGAREWFTELSIRQSDDVGMTVADGVVIVAGGRLGNRGPHTIVVDEKTGRRLWSSAQDLMSPRRGSDTLLTSDGPPTKVMARDKRTGVSRWVLSLAAGLLGEACRAGRARGTDRSPRAVSAAGTALSDQPQHRQARGHAFGRAESGAGRRRHLVHRGRCCRHRGRRSQAARLRYVPPERSEAHLAEHGCHRQRGNLCVRRRDL